MEKGGLGHLWGMFDVKLRIVRYTSLLCLILVWASACGQPVEREKLALPEGGVFFYVTDQEKPMLIGKDLSIFGADSISGVWRNVADASTPGQFEQVDQCDFFNDSTGFLSGQGSVYRTTDAGASWHFVNFGQDGWVDGTCSLDDGRAWMSISGKGIAYSSDCGAHWKALPIVTTNNQRYGALFFNTKQEGIVGSMWNVIGYTPDNCQHWRQLPTPLGQKKYNKTDRAARPEILRVAIFKDYFLVNQENMVFATRRDSIDWKPLGYTDFCTDGNNSALFMVSERGQVVRMNDALRPVATYSSQPHVWSFFCRNGKLFSWNGDKIKRFSTDNTVVEAALETDQAAGDYPITFGYSDDHSLRYGSIGRKIYLGYVGEEYDDMDNGTWRYLLTLPFAVGDSSTLYYEPEQSQIVCRSANDSLRIYNIYQQTVRVTTVHDLIKDFGDVGIDTVTVTHSSQGCFHGYSDYVTYARYGTKYKFINSQMSGLYPDRTTSERLKNFDGAVVRRFVRGLCDNYDRLPAFDDLGFTAADLKQCKHNILEFKNSTSDDIQWGQKRFYFSRNNIDFDRLLRMVDSAKYISPGHLRDVFTNTEYFSTTSYRLSVRLVNTKGATMYIRYSYFQSNAFCFPWDITIDGVAIQCFSPLVTDFVRQVCPSMLPEGDRVPVLHGIVKGMY